jgi:hypothetical protein
MAGLLCDQTMVLSVVDQDAYHNPLSGDEGRESYEYI